MTFNFKQLNQNVSSLNVDYNTRKTLQDLIIAVTALQQALNSLVAKVEATEGPAGYSGDNESKLLGDSFGS